MVEYTKYDVVNFVKVWRVTNDIQGELSNEETERFIKELHTQIKKMPLLYSHQESPRRADSLAVRRNES